MKHIVKRKGHSEAYDPKKIYAAVYASCLAVRVPEGESELVAERVSKDVAAWLHPKHEVTAHDIRIQATKHLQVYNPDAAWMLAHHRVIN